MASPKKNGNGQGHLSIVSNPPSIIERSQIAVAQEEMIDRICLATERANISLDCDHREPPSATEIAAEVLANLEEAICRNSKLRMLLKEMIADVLDERKS